MFCNIYTSLELNEFKYCVTSLAQWVMHEALGSYALILIRKSDKLQWLRMLLLKYYYYWFNYWTLPLAWVILLLIRLKMKSRPFFCAMSQFSVISVWSCWNLIKRRLLWCVTSPSETFWTVCNFKHKKLESLTWNLRLTRTEFSDFL